MDEPQIPQSAPSKAALPEAAKRFLREIRDDHQFWLHAIAVKSGAGAILVAAVYGTSAALAAPPLFCALGIGACAGAVGIGLYGVFAGANRTVDKALAVWRRVRGDQDGAPQAPAARAKTPVQSLLDKSFMKKIAAAPAVQKITGSKAWQATRRFTRKQEKRILAGVAVGGSVLYMALGVTLLATLPVAAIGAAAIVAAGYVVSGTSGLYFSIVGLVDGRRTRRKTAEAAPAVSPVPQDEPDGKISALTPLKESFSMERQPSPPPVEAEPAVRPETKASRQTP